MAPSMLVARALELEMGAQKKRALEVAVGVAVEEPKGRLGVAVGLEMEVGLGFTWWLEVALEDALEVGLEMAVEAPPSLQALKIPSALSH